MINLLIWNSNFQLHRMLILYLNKASQVQKDNVGQMLNIRGESAQKQQEYRSLLNRMRLRIKFLEFSKKLVVIFPLIILKLAIVLEDKIIIIIKFSKWKDCRQIFSAKKDLSKLDMKELDFPEGTQILLNQSLCLYYNSL